MKPKAKHIGFRISSLLLLLSLFPSAFVLAQSQKMYFEEVRTPEGNPLGKIVAITQDKFGFMWFADESNRMLVRYDGSHMEYYRHDPENLNSPAGYRPHHLYAAPSGEIWIGYLGDGLDRFDPYTNTFTHYRNDPEDPESLPSDIVPYVFVDRQGMVWMATSVGLARLDASTGKFTLFRHDPNDPSSPSSNSGWKSYEDSSGTLWVGTGLPFPGIDPKDGGLNRYNPDTGTFTRYLPDPDDPTSLGGYKVTAILEDSKGNFWVGTEGDGLHIMDRKTGRFTRHPYNPDHPENLSRPVLTRQDYAFISFLLEDSTGQIWIGTVDNGVSRYNPDSDQVTHFSMSSEFREDVVQNDDWKSFRESNSAWDGYAGKDGLVWITTEMDAKLYKIDLSRETFTKVNEAGVNIFFDESPNVIWKGTDKGLIKEDLKAGTETVYKNLAGDSTSISNNWVTSIAKDQMGQYWIGTLNGLNVLDPMVGTFKRYMHDPEDPASLSHPWVNDVMLDRLGNIWAGTENGLNRLDPESGTLHIFLATPRDSTHLPNYWINKILEDPQGSLWFCAPQLGMYDPETGTLRSYPLTIGGLLVDTENTLWAWNDSGLFKYDPEEDLFIDSGITSYNNRVIADNRNNLWIHNTNGIVRFDPTTGRTTLFAENYGVRGTNQAIKKDLYRKKDGTLVFTMSNAFYEINPDDFRQSRDTTLLYATLLEMSGAEDQPVNRISLLKRNGQDEPIELKASENAFSIRFAAIDFRSTGNTPIQYMLEGYDSEWVQGSAAFPAHYAQVPPGDYTFRLRAVNSSSGIPSENSLKLKILPPWWATWWAYAAYGLLFVLGLWIVDRYQKKRVLRTAREKAQRRELEQAKEIEKAYSELKATQTQLIHSEKMASLGELTAGIAHEIQNPLNFVNNFSEVSRELIDEMKEEIKKKEFGEVDAIADDLKQNLEKITHHGKRADGIVKGMLQHSRVSDGKKEPADLNKLVDEYLRLAYHGMRARDKAFNVRMDTDLDDRVGEVNMVSQDIGRVLLNLLTNAFHAVKEKSEQPPDGYEPIVKVRTQKTTKGVRVEVSDNGNGIPESIRNKIFQPFFTTKPTGQGTGLGLSLSFDIAKAHGGDLQVKSTEGEGTTFTIVLPA